MAAAPFFWEEKLAASFPPSFVEFLRQNQVHPENYEVSEVPRYVRLAPRSTLTQGELEKELGGVEVSPVRWLPGYFSLPASVKIAGSAAYRSGDLYGIDVASGAAVAALGVRRGEHVLDVCCAPGAKLCALADALDGTGSVTGVDVSEERMFACRSICRKYRLQNVRLLVADAVTFREPPPELRAEQNGGEAYEAAVALDACAGALDSSAPALTKESDPCLDAELSCAQVLPLGRPPTSGSTHESGGGTSAHKDPELCDSPNAATGGGRPARQGVGPGRKGKRRRRTDDSEPMFIGTRICHSSSSTNRNGTGGAERPESSTLASRPQLYDKVLVDAECTHDGSVKHLAKFSQWGWESFERRFLDPERLASLRELQYQLLRTGFSLLREGGSLVYSTCSFTIGQNEEVVSRLLREEPAATVVPVDCLAQAPCHPGGLKHTLRFDPRTSRTSALFIAKIEKRRERSDLQRGGDECR